MSKDMSLSEGNQLGYIKNMHNIQNSSRSKYEYKSYITCLESKSIKCNIHKSNIFIKLFRKQMSNHWEYKQAQPKLGGSEVVCRAWEPRSTVGCARSGRIWRFSDEKTLEFLWRRLGFSYKVKGLVYEGKDNGDVGGYFWWRKHDQRWSKPPIWALKIRQWPKLFLACFWIEKSCYPLGFKVGYGLGFLEEEEMNVCRKSRAAWNGRTMTRCH